MKTDKSGKAWHANTKPFPLNSILTIKIDDLTNLGMGVGRVKLSDDTYWVVFVPYVLPGEIVQVRISRNRQKYSDAELIEVLEPSSERVVPMCKYYYSCGGCQYQHISIKAQRLWKRSQVVNALTRVGLMQNPFVNPVVGSNDVYAYRTKITPQYNLPKGMKEPFIGFCQRGKGLKVMDVEHCAIATPLVNEKLKILYDELKGDVTLSKQSKRGANGGATASVLLLREVDGGMVETDPTPRTSTALNSASKPENSFKITRLCCLFSSIMW